MRRACSQACRSPNRSKWLIRKVELTARAQPAAYTAQSTPAPGPCRLQAIPPIGRHSQNSSASTRHAASTNVDRSAGCGTIRVQRRLNHGRAITVCCTANSISSHTSMPAATGTPARVP
jgi:hypothetical protein